MPILINKHELTDEDIAAELPLHQDAPNPLKRATTAVAIRHILLDEAERLGLRPDKQEDTEEALSRLLAHAVPLPELNDAAMHRFYEQHPQRFTQGELVEASHILFQVTPNAPLEGLKHLAQLTLDELREHPERFADTAGSVSNCPSAQVGGSLGQLTRGQTVPEFERVLFAAEPGQVHPDLVATRFGFHIVLVHRKIAGRLLPFHAVRGQIAEAMRAQVQDTAWRQYVQVLVGQARIEGIELEGVATPLVQ